MSENYSPVPWSTYAYSLKLRDRWRWAAIIGWGFAIGILAHRYIPIF